MSIYPSKWNVLPTTSGMKMWLLVGSLSASLVFALPSVACGLVGGGDEESEEEPAVASTEAEVLQLELDALFRDLDAQKTAHNEAKAKLQVLQAQAEAREQEEQSRLVSLEKARLIVLRYAGENTAVYGPDYADAPLVWEVASAESGEEFYYIRLTYRPAGNFEGKPGVEEFITDKEGAIEFRQVLEHPDSDAMPTDAAEEESQPEEG